MGSCLCHVAGREPSTLLRSKATNGMMGLSSYESKSQRRFVEPLEDYEAGKGSWGCQAQED